jgi:hypothetical protein
VNGILDRLGMAASVPGLDLDDPSSAAAGLFDTEALEHYRRVLQRLAKPYRLDRRDRPVLSAYAARHMDASTGLVSSVRDLARFDAALDDGILLATSTLEAAWTPAVAPAAVGLPVGLGWFVQSYRGERIVWHFGAAPGAASSMLIKVPARNLTLILLANSDGLSSGFSLENGDVTTSPFARLFLQLAVRVTPGQEL